MFTQAADMVGTEHIIMLITEYFSSAPKAGFMRINLNASYQESQSQDEEKVFTGYDLVFTSALFPSSELAFAMAVDQTDMMTYLV